ncbi:MAG: hypothetical protein GXO88_01935 [Chlorobi bacterium]|nr:hypothetical protein [Chlorobiota bacterium]
MKEYTKGNLTVVWEPGACIHAAICVKMLPNVYQPGKKPWINLDNAEQQQLIDQINACPSGALSYNVKGENTNLKTNIKMEKPNVAGTSPVIIGLEEGKNYAWCSCGKSTNQPWCDGSHKGSGMSPVVFKAEESKKRAMCLCKHSASKPYCDGSHSKL